ncbi:hypothetical protein [Methanoregula sp.]|uniref:hypothetical protein n=1 Tax=Methanoregula sp. TaxID=2052170 RepID=UPI002BCCE5CA|nr:hypothetical protein [Methanoregula sp.]HVP96597.1 hypothetical protein [Methanoregula sp.]
MKLTGKDSLVRSLLLAIVFGVPGALIIIGIFNVILGDSLIAFGFIGEKAHGWVFIGVGVMVYLIELFVYSIILKRGENTSG